MGRSLEMAMERSPQLSRCGRFYALFLFIVICFSFQAEGAAWDDSLADELIQTDAQAGELKPKTTVSKKPSLEVEDEEGIKVIDEYEKANKHLQAQEAKLRDKLAHPPESMKGITYGSVPGFAFSYQGRRMRGKSRSSCELICNTYAACKSYSYNSKTSECIWSLSHVTYNADFNLHVKKSSAGKGLYHELPGMMLFENKKKPLKNVSKAECVYKCTKDESCHSWSYSHTKKMCYVSGQKLDYIAGFTYYEKDQHSEVPKWKQEHKKENTWKEKIKAKWLKSSTKASRAKIERNTKIVSNKHKSLVKLAAKNKSRMRKLGELRIKACHSMKLAKIRLSTETSKMEKSEAKAKLAAKTGKEANSEHYKKVAATMLRGANHAERQSKSKFAAAKAGYEAASKAELKATSERGRKSKLAAKVKAKAAMVHEHHVTSTTLKTAMKAKETYSKSNETLKKKKEKDHKAKKLVETRKHEAHMKKLKIKLAAQAAARKERGKKRERSDKAIKKKELLKKKIKEQERKGEAKIKAVKKQQLRNKMALAAKEHSFKVVARANERSKKKKKARANKIAHLTKNENTAKSKSREAQLKTSILARRKKVQQRKEQAAKRSLKRRTTLKVNKTATAEKAAKGLKHATSEKAQKIQKRKERNAKANSRVAGERQTKARHVAAQRKANAARANARWKVKHCLGICQSAKKRRTTAAARQRAQALKLRALANKLKNGGRHVGEGMGLETRKHFLYQGCWC